MKEKVSLIECRNYDYDRVKDSIIRSFEKLGGIDRYINKDEKVLLKINLLMKKKPEEATTTHPIFIKALSDVLVEYGAKVLIGDSPGGPFNERALKSIYKYCGVEEIVKDSDAELNYNTEMVEVKNDKGRILKSLTVVDMLNDVDKVISVSKLKTHGMATFTGAVKNMFGIVPGILKAEYHFKMPDIKVFSDALVDICLCGNPILSFMDGIVGMEGDGPSAGNPRDIGAVIASTSPYHLDVVAISIINLEAKRVPTIERCMERGICKGNFEDIDLLGEGIDKFKIEDFQIPHTRSVRFVNEKMPRFIRQISDSLLKPKPIFVHEDCVGCRDCAENCPPKIIEMIENRPVADLDKCIRCFCCQELCPKKAVVIHTPWLMKGLSKL